MDGTTSNERPNLLLANLPNLAIFVVIGWGVISSKAPLTSVRPNSHAPATKEVVSTVEARYWQDPFFWEPAKVDWRKSNILLPTTKSDKPVLGLVVLLNGDRYAETVETRTRTRYAVVSALLQAGYQGTTSGDLNLTVFDTWDKTSIPGLGNLSCNELEKSEKLQKVEKFRTTYAWERFQPFTPEPTQFYRQNDGGLVSPLQTVPETRYGEVQIFYIDENSLSKNLFPRLQILTHKIRDTLQSEFTTPDIRLAVLGPSDSHGLIDLMGGAIRESDFDKGFDFPFPIYAPSPTISQPVLKKLVVDSIGYSGLPNIDNIISNDFPYTIDLPNHPIYRTNGTDDEVLSALVDEISDRGIKLEDRKVRFALVTEADTSYARTIPDRFIHTLREYNLRHFSLPWYKREWNFICDSVLDRKAKPDWLEQVEPYCEDRAKECDGLGLSKIREQFLPLTTNTSLGDSLHFEQAFESQLAAANLNIPQDSQACLWEWALLSRAISANAEGQPEVALRLLTDVPGFCHRLDQQWKPDVASKDVTTRKVEVFTYLRGVDGKLDSEQGGSSQATSEESSKETSSGKRDPATLGQEPAQGAGQYDYVRRMVTELAEEDRIGQEHGEGNVRVIGVTGSDVYDKLVILRALKHQFPSVILFTTDLNAADLQSSESDFTRGLLVGSHFGLNIPMSPDNLQFSSAVAPFRDSYQTAIYDTCLKILNEKKDSDLVPPKAQIFEVSESGFYPLTGNEASDSRTPHPWLAGLSFSVDVALVLVVLFLTFGNFYFVADKATNSFTFCFFMMGLIVFVSLSVVVHTLSQQAWQEPFALFEGISSWPTTLIRALAILFSLFFMWRIYKLLRLRSREFDDLSSSWAQTGTKLRKLPGFSNQLYTIYEVDEATQSNDTLDFPKTYAEAFVRYRDKSKRSDKIRKWRWQIFRAILPWFGFTYPTNVSSGTPVSEQIIQGAVDSFFRKTTRVCKKGDSNKTELKRNQLKWPFFSTLLRLAGLRTPRNRSILGQFPGYFRIELNDYRRKGQLRWRLVRTFLILLANFAFVFAMALCLDFPMNPTRGGASRLIFVVILGLSIMAGIALTYLVVDALALSQSLVVWMKNRLTDLEEFQEKDPAGFYVAPKMKFVGEAIDFVASQTSAVNSIVYYPFIVLLLMLFARDSLFDHYDWPLSLALVTFVPYFILAWVTYYLMADARRLQHKALELLKDDSRRDQLPRGVKDKLLQEIERIEKVDSGAFGDVSTSPFMRALLIPLGGVGSLQLISYLQQFLG